MIEIRGLTKRYGPTVAVDGLNFDVPPGSVTGFLGANGSGKSTTMRMIMGLDRPDTGRARIGGRAYRDLPWPLREVGALLETRAFDPGRRADQHLLALAASNGIGRRRVDEVLGLVGLAGAARTRAGQFSLGMAQRLGVASALLGDPAVVLLDAPGTGLDPAGTGRRVGVWGRAGRAAAGGAGQRPGPGGHPVDRGAAEVPGRRGPHGLRVQPPDQRDGPDRRPPGGDRPGQAAGPDHGGGTVGQCPLPGGGVLRADR